MRHIRLLALVAALLMTTALAAPLGANPGDRFPTEETVVGTQQPGGTVVPHVERRVSETLSALEERRAPADRVREAIEDGGLVDWIVAAIRASGHQPPAVPPLPRPRPAQIVTVETAGLPPAATEALAGLFAATQAADAMLGRTTAQDLQEGIERLQATVVHRATVENGQLVEEFGRLTDVPGAQAPRSVSAERAALLVAAALDRHLPALRAAASDLTPRPGTVEGCDMLDRLPYLCVGSAADNVYSESAILLVDLGGSDTYRNSAGGAPFPDSDTDDGLIRLSVNVDLGDDDDRYESPPPITSTSPPLLVGQGAALGVSEGAALGDPPGAVGILVDEGGDDTYEVIGAGGPIGLAAQGSTFLGVGLLADLGGNDRYAARIESTPGRGNLFAQGAGVNGTGLLVDLGSGDDVYEVDVAGHPDGGCYWVAAQGAGGPGAGILSDGGGEDRIVYTGVAEAEDDGYHDDLEFGGFLFAVCPSDEPGLTAYVQASSIQLSGGAAFLLTGEGDTEYRAEHRGRGPVSMLTLHAQGFGAPFTNAVLDDRGGDDSYVMKATVRTDVEVVVDDDCTDCASMVVSRQNDSFFSLEGQGSRQGAILWDHGEGDDRYEASLDASVTLHVSDARSEEGDRPQIEVASGSYWMFFALGLSAQGSFSISNPPAALVDEGGRDTYLARATNHAAATTDSPSSVDARAYSFHRPKVDAQGSGGILLDLGGAGDTFEVASVGRASATDPANQFSTAGGLTALPHGYGDGQFIALGSEPTVASHPATGVCPRSSPGHRGYGWWFDRCMPTPSGFGWAGETAGRAPVLTLAEEPPSDIEVGRRVPLAARLVDDDGRPISGAELHFILQLAAAEVLPPIAGQVEALGFGNPWGFFDTWQVTGTTDEDGVARASLPVETIGTPAFSGDRQWNLVVIYDGEGGERYPQQVSAPVEVRG